MPLVEKIWKITKDLNLVLTSQNNGVYLRSIRFIIIRSKNSALLEKPRGWFLETKTQGASPFYFSALFLTKETLASYLSKC
jgi:hypothetical protein